ncbi:pigment-dispersing factor [Calliopsis andreniformis]|uniref:pigment-dispersing factor n=1 Tax=Calliopsis andreniformis TaxID=337506 RepID=UPI003FCCC797
MTSMKCTIILIMMLGIIYETLGTIEDSERNLVGMNFPYGRGLDSEMQLARLLLLPLRLYHPKRNSELINSLLGLPKNMNNAGK